MSGPGVDSSRRGVLFAGIAGAAWAASPPPGLCAEADLEFVRRLTGRIPVASARVHLRMPPVFGSGYTVPMALDVDSPMTAADHVRLVHVFAPRNPIVLVATFRFTPHSGLAAISTRVRLSEPQTVLAAAEMSDGSVLLGSTFVKVESNGCQ